MNIIDERILHMKYNELCRCVYMLNESNEM